MPNAPKYRTEDAEEAPEEPTKNKGGRPRRNIPALKSQSIDEIDKKVEARYQELLRDFDETALTRGDIDQIRNRAFMSVAAEENSRKLLSATAGILPLTPNEFQALTKSVNDLSKEIRLIDETLGIDRRTRMASEQSELEAALPNAYKDARQFLYKYAISIICLECRKSIAQTDIRTGILLYHFFEEDLDWTATFRCQRESCGRLFTINHENWHTYRMDAIDAIKPPKQDDDDS